MKKLLLFFIFTQIVAVLSAQVSIKVRVSMPGDLYTAITDAGGDPTKVTSLTVTGTIDARDFRTMRDDMPALTVIDLSAVSITTYKGIGGTADAGSLGNPLEVASIGGVLDGTPVDYYPAKTIPKNAFANLPSRKGATPVMINFGDSKTQQKSRFTSITLPEKITSIAGNAFYRCNGLTSITIPGSVTSINNNAFYGCSSLSTVAFPKKITKIGSAAFSGCSSLTSIAIPQSVISLGNGAFSGSNVAFTVDPNNAFFSSVDGVLFDKAQTKLLQCPISKKGSYSIPNTVRSIVGSAFKNCTGLTTISIPNSVTSMGSFAFYGCSGLTSVIIPNSVTSIAGYAFYDCSSLTSVVIPHSVTSIQNFAFYHCSSLAAITIPNSITSIGINVFADCASLTSVSIPHLLTSISEDIFAECSSLTTVNIPNSVTSIGNYAFMGCKSLTSVVLPTTVKTIGMGAFMGCTRVTTICISDSIYDIGMLAFAGCGAQFSVNANSAKFSSVDGVLFNKNQTQLLQCPASRSGNYSIPASVTFIAGGAFSNCNKLTTVDIHSQVDSIRGSFNGCSANISVDKENLKYSTVDGVLFNKNQTVLMHFPTSRTGSYTIPNTVITIDGSSFEKCDGLTSIVIPESVKTLGGSCFNFCTSLTSITVHSSIPVELNFFDVFHKIDKRTCKLYVPSGSKSLYQAANQWKDFQNIIEVTPN